MKIFKFVMFMFAAAYVSVCNAEVQSTPTPTNPVVDTTPYVGDDLKVLAFIKFGCPICRKYKMSLEHWGRTLPKEFAFQFYPVLESDSKGAITEETARGSMMFWAVERSGNQEQRSAFSDAAYSLSQDMHEQESLNAWLDAVAGTGITKQAFVTSWTSEIKIWHSRYARQAHYMPTATPTLVICGKWMISPDSTNGDQELFMQLANGLVSKCMLAHSIAPKS